VVGKTDKVYRNEVVTLRVTSTADLPCWPAMGRVSSGLAPGPRA